MFMIFKFGTYVNTTDIFCFNAHGKLVVKLDFSKHECLFSRDADAMFIDFLRLGALYLKVRVQSQCTPHLHISEISLVVRQKQIIFKVTKVNSP